MRSGSEILLDMWDQGDGDCLDFKNLRNLVRHGEGQRLEFKMKVKFPEKLSRSWWPLRIRMGVICLWEWGMRASWKA